MKYRRILLKMSGESLGGSAGTGIDEAALISRAHDIADAVALGLEVGIVPGGGNIFRGSGSKGSGIRRVTGDSMGMLATVMNALALADHLSSLGISAFVRASFVVGSLVKAFDQVEVRALMSTGAVGIFPGGTGNPYFTTDTAAALRALEINADVLLKGTRVDGVFSADPEQVDGARSYRVISFEEVLEKRLSFMDLTATTLCRENNLPLIVFNQNKSGSMKRILLGEEEGTLVSNESNHHA